jgi:hypothetical protein
LVYSSPTYASIKRLLNILAFVPPKEDDNVDVAGDSKKVRVMFKFECGG